MRHGAVLATPFSAHAWSARWFRVLGSRPPRAAPSHKEMSMADETYKGEFYCVKCKAKREAEGK